MLLGHLYESLEVTYTSTRTSIYRARRRVDGVPVVMKSNASTMPDAVELAMLRHEYDMLGRLDGQGVPRLLGLEEDGERLVLILEDTAHESLACPCDSLEHFLALAIGIVQALEQVHVQGILHRDIKPSNVVFNASDQSIKLIDFGAATSMHDPSPHVVGTMAYMSPEQTGRMSREVDERSDLYAVGMTFYELLSGALPFAASDPLEWARCHLSVKPAPLEERVTSLPRSLAALVHRLIRKDPEDRYQSASGLLHDLLWCAQQLKELGAIPEFELGQRDYHGKLSLAPLPPFERARLAQELLGHVHGASSVTCVYGPRGTGKRDLIDHVSDEHITMPCMVITCAMTHVAVHQLVAQWVDDILRDPGRVSTWRTILASLPTGHASSLIASLPSLSHLCPSNHSDRSNHSPFATHDAWSDLIALICEHEPFVVVCRDASTLDVMSQQVFAHLISTHRFGASHLLMLHDGWDRPTPSLPVELQHVSFVDVLPMTPRGTEAAVRHLLADADVSASIASLAHREVGGHTRRIRLWLAACIEHGALVQDRTRGTWCWYEERLDGMAWPATLQKIMSHDIVSLPLPIRQLLMALACFGTPCTRDALADVLAWSAAQVEEHLEGAITHHFVHSVVLDSSESSPRYQLRAERYGTIAMTFWSDEDISRLHWRCAQYMCARLEAPEDARSCAALFEHDRHAWRTRDDHDERLEIALRMSRAAEFWHDAADHERALCATEVGLELLAHTSHPDTATVRHRLLMTRASSLYTTGQMHEALQCSEQVFVQHDDALAYARLGKLKMLILSQLGQYAECIHVALKHLDALGISFPDDPEAMEEAVGAGIASMCAHLERVPASALHLLPEAEDHHHQLSFELMMMIAPAVFQTNPSLFVLIELTMFDLSLRRGIVPLTAQCLGPCGMIAHNILKDHDLAVELGAAAMAMAARFAPHRVEAVVCFVNGACLMHLREPPSKVLGVLEQAWRLSQQFNDVENGPYAAQNLVMVRRMLGRPFDEVQTQLERSMTYCRALGSEPNIHIMHYYSASLEVLRSARHHSKALREIKTLRTAHTLSAGQPDTDTCISYLEEAYVHFWMEDEQAAWNAWCEVEPLLPFIQGVITEYHALIYGALIAAMYLNAGHDTQREHAIAVLSSHHLLLARVAQNNPEMYGAIYALVSAEKARFEYAALEVVLDHYSDCIKLAGSGFLQWRALANERQADLWNTRHQARLVSLFVEEAFELYGAWGARLKCARLQARHPVCIKLHQDRLQPAIPPLLTTLNGTESVQWQRSTQQHSLDDSFDMQSVLNATSAIASTMRTAELYDTLLDTMVNHAGAEYGSLILWRDERLVEVATTVNKANTPAQGRTLRPMEEVEHLVHEVIRHCVHTQKSVLLADAMSEGMFTHNTSIQTRHVQSLLCMPIMERGQLLGVLYLENNLMSHAFSARHLNVLTLLSGQAAVSLQNTMIFENLEAEVEARTAQLAAQHREIRMLLDHLPHGVITLDAHMCIEPRFSAQMVQIMGRDDFVGKTLEETLLVDAHVSREALCKMRAVLEFSFGMPAFMAMMNWDHLLHRFTRIDADGEAQHLVVDWSPITDDDDDVQRVMLTVRDETKLHALEQTAHEHARELEIINQLLGAGLRDFQEFSFNARQRLNENHLMGDEENLGDDSILSLLFRNFHTIKGNARLLGLDLLSQAAHVAEEPIAALRSIPAARRTSVDLDLAAEQIDAALHRFIAVLQDYEEVLADNFGELLQENHAIDTHVVARLRAEVARARAEPSEAMAALEAMHILLSNTEAVSLDHVVNKTARMFDRLAVELGKPAPEVCVKGDSVWMTFGFGSVLHDTMIHVFRNAFDHGIELPEVREAAGKRVQGLITLSAKKHEQGTYVDIHDDGAGLAIHTLRAQSPDPSLCDEALAAEIFEAGRSTMEQVTSISGRGVGMDAVRTFLAQQGCTIEIIWTTAQADARGYRPFALRLDIPQAQLIKLH